jgi:hypothetical protein
MEPFNPAADARLADSRFKGPIKNEARCPFGCINPDEPGDRNDEDLDCCDERGYCRHLKGFTNDGRMMEIRTIMNGREYTGSKFVERILKSDRIVKAMGPTSRVYRKHANAPFEDVAETKSEPIPLAAEQEKSETSAILEMLTRMESGQRQQAETIRQQGEKIEKLMKDAGFKSEPAKPPEPAKPAVDGK